MIQRVQSIYLFVAFSLLIALFFLPMGRLALPQQTTNGVVEHATQATPSGESFYVTGVKSVSGEMLIPTYPLAIILGLAAIFVVGAFFSFKNRVLQSKITLFATLILVAYTLLSAYLIWRTDGMFEANIVLSLPIIALLFLLLALRGVQKDEKLVRESNRLR